MSAKPDAADRPDFDSLRFDVMLAVQLHCAVPRTNRDRNRWAEYAAGRIADYLRLHWDFRRKRWLQHPMDRARRPET